MGSLVVGGARTPFGKLLGGLAEHPATELGGFAIAAALERAGVPAGAVDQVVMGQVLTAGCGQLPARQAAVAGGIGMGVPAVSVNKVCLSGLTAVALADQLIRAGECEVVVAGGMESMSRAPHLLPGSRAGHRYGDATLVDHLAADGLADVWTSQSMGALTESANVGPGRISREAQDAFSARSHQRAAAAAELLAEEIVAVRTPQRRGPGRVLTADEGVRPGTDPGTLAGLRPAFAADGTITAGSASPISDGAAAVVVASPAAVERLGLSPWAEVLGHGQVAGPDSTLQHQPAAAVRAACARAGVDPAALDLLEVNEAFAAVALASAADLGLGPEQVEERLNVHGGAIALGHPIGASGARLVLHLAAELRRRGRGPDAGGGRPVLAAAALCGGGGQGDALVLRGVR